MIKLISVLLWCCSFSFLFTQQEQYQYSFKSQHCIVGYQFEEYNDSTFMYGKVVDKRTKKGVLNMNIMLLEFRIGTVTDLNGNFRIFLPIQKGSVVFVKTAFDKFSIVFKNEETQKGG